MSKFKNTSNEINSLYNLANVNSVEYKLAQKDRQITDLEAKLTESEEERDGNYENYSICWKENEQLKQQLAEKDKLINEYANSLDKVFGEKVDLSFKNNQDKISFAVEQLEKVKELLYPELRFDYSLYLRVMHELDNQIKQLKEGK